MTIFHTVRTLNLTHLALPSKLEVQNATVRKYVYIGKCDESPKKRGRLPRITDTLLEASNIHVTGMQSSGDISKADKSIMMANIDAMVQGAAFDGSFIT